MLYYTVISNKTSLFLLLSECLRKRERMSLKITVFFIEIEIETREIETEIEKIADIYKI
jgi:hypothetical protein